MPRRQGKKEQSRRLKGNINVLKRLSAKDLSRLGIKAADLSAEVMAGRIRQAQKVLEGEDILRRVSQGGLTSPPEL